MQIVDPVTGQIGTISGGDFWGNYFRPLVTAARSRMGRYVVLDQTPVWEEKNNAKRQTSKQKRRVAELTLMKESDMGSSDSQVVVRSHLGYLCKSGDTVLCYNLTDTNIVDDEARENLEKTNMQDVVVVRKLYGGGKGGEEGKKLRNWRLQRLDVEIADDLRGKKEEEKMNVDEEDFLRELESDREMRERVNLYKLSEAKKRTSSSDSESENEEDDQKVQLEELLDSLDLDSKPDADDQMVVGGVPVTLPDFNEDLAYGGQVGLAWEEGARANQDGIGFIDRDEKVEDKTQPVMVQQFGKEFMKGSFKFT
ncbi:hypothetical protein TrVE_jg7954 [Triparma verrucosa]|uniref:60S ribosomal export protein NMD3 OB-fold domain-containing protein n=1 Tax=Triparma verrucosa TaxID=1606542 RepID=A0A9W6ZHR4_9STRA|nr:hypothetical protein TrVE_jg7954 [Triparma verrucosa]